MERDPLSWPSGQPRTPSHKVTRNWRFSQDHTVASATNELMAELGRLGATDIIISSNMQYKGNGLPYSKQPAMTDCGVAVYFTLHKRPMVLACDRWDRLQHNLWAIAKHIEALRGIDRWGVGTVEQLFRGYEALPETTTRSWWQVLQVERSATVQDIEQAFRRLAKERHPDAGGSQDLMSELNEARRQAMSEKGGAS